MCISPLKRRRNKQIQVDKPCVEKNKDAYRLLMLDVGWVQSILSSNYPSSQARCVPPTASSLPSARGNAPKSHHYNGKRPMMRRYRNRCPWNPKGQSTDVTLNGKQHLGTPHGCVETWRTTQGSRANHRLPEDSLRPLRKTSRSKSRG